MPEPEHLHWIRFWLSSTASKLDVWAKRIRGWSAGRPTRDGEFVTQPLDDGKPRDVFLFFDNTDKLQAPGVPSA